MAEFLLSKPDIPADKVLTKEEQLLVESALKERGARLIFKMVKPYKNDYSNEYDRGTVEYNPKHRNYSFHKVIIPDNTIIKDSNFTQRNIDTKAIEGKNLTFIDCNLTNNIIDESWKLQGSNCMKIDFSKLEEEK